MTFGRLKFARLIVATVVFLFFRARSCNSFRLLPAVASVFSSGSCSSSKLAMSSEKAPLTTKDECKTKVIRVLALHGSGGNAASFAETLESWRDYFLVDDNIDLQITTVEAHVEKDDGFAWWYLPPGLRSSTADTYDGFDKSERLVLDALTSEEGPFDLLFGHSQGAILTTALLSLGKIQQHPRLGYILNGVAWPNPYTSQLESLQLDDESLSPRILVIVGEKDQMNPPEQAARVAIALEKAGCDVTTLPHSRGHAVPTDDKGTLEPVRQWILEAL